MEPTQAELHAVFDYRDGALIWRPRPAADFRRPCDYARWLNNHEGRAAGYEDPRGYRQVRLRGFRKMLLAHRLVWIWHRGPIAAGSEVDHLNGDARDNRIENLRAVSHSTNLTNRAKLRSNTSGHTGVSWIAERGLWRARGYIGAASKHLGYFTERADAEAAMRAYWKASGCTPRHGL